MMITKFASEIEVGDIVISPAEKHHEITSIRRVDGYINFVSSEGDTFASMPNGEYQCLVQVETEEVYAYNLVADDIVIRSSGTESALDRVEPIFRHPGIGSTDIGLYFENGRYEEVKSSFKLTIKKRTKPLSLDLILRHACGNPEDHNLHSQWTRENPDAFGENFKPYPGWMRYEIEVHCVKFIVIAKSNGDGTYVIREYQIENS